MSTSKQIFVSHSHHDLDMSRIIVKELKAYKCNIWYDEESMESSRIRRGIETGLTNSQVFLLLLSEAAITSYWVGREIDAAFALEAETGLLIVPALIRPCIVPLLLRGYQYLDFVNIHDLSIELTRFLQMLGNIPASSTGPTQKALQEHVGPQKGQRSHSISNIKANNVHINQGTQAYNFYGNVTASNNTYDTINLTQLKMLTDDLNTALNNGQKLEVRRIEIFIKMMYSLGAHKKTLPLQLAEEVDMLCKRLSILSLL